MTSAVVALEEIPAHLAAVADQLARQDDAALHARVIAATRTIGAERERLFRRALQAHSVEAKVHWLRTEADLVAQTAAPLSPCRAGCAHCCHQGVAIARKEAELIGREIGRPVATPPAARVLRPDLLERAESAQAQMERFQQQRAWMVDTYTGVPCTFLVGDRCSIYAHRPIVCRLHISLAEDDLLCRFVPGHDEVRVPYVDARGEQQLYVMALADERLALADIRDWFPHKEAK